MTYSQEDFEGEFAKEYWLERDFKNEILEALGPEPPPPQEPPEWLVEDRPAWFEQFPKEPLDDFEVYWWDREY